MINQLIMVFKSGEKLLLLRLVLTNLWLGFYPAPVIEWVQLAITLWVTTGTKYQGYLKLVKQPQGSVISPVINPLLAHLLSRLFVICR